MKDWRVAVAAVVTTIAVVGAAQAITEPVFQYSSPKTGWFTIDPSDMTPNNNADVIYDRGTAQS